MTYAHTLAAGTAIALLGLAPQAFAASVAPIPFPGAPTTQDVIAACELPDVAQPNSPEVVSVNNVPQNAGNTFASPDGNFVVELQLTQSKNPPLVRFADLSPNIDSQFFDTRGIEAVVVRSSQSSNIFCYINKPSDTALAAPGSSATHVAVFWAKGPCGLADQNTLDTVCAQYGATAETLQGITSPQLGATGGETPVNFCGCVGVPRFCDPGIAAGQPGSCNPEGGVLSGYEDIGIGTAGTNTCQLVKKGGTWVNQCF